MNAYLIVTPYGKAEDCGKKYLVRMPDMQYVGPGTTVVCAKGDGRELLYTAMTPDFRSEDTIMDLWNATPESIRTVVAILHRHDLDVADERVMTEVPTIDG